MFDKITIHAKNTFNNPGILCESLIFYQESILIVDPGSFIELINYCGYNNLTELIRSGQLKIDFNHHSLGAGNVKDNLFIISSFSSDKHKKSNVIKSSIEKQFGRNIQSHNMSKHLSRIIGNHEYSTGFIDLLKKELDNPENLISALTIESKGKLTKDNVKLNIEQVNSGMYNIESNIDNETIRNAAFLIVTGAGEIYDAKSNNSELVTNNKISSYTENKINRLIEKRIKNEKQIKSFHEIVLPEFYDLKGTINAGNQEFNDFMELWRVATAFKEWLRDEPPNVEILTAYIRKISEKTWLDKIPAKNVRWLIFASIGTLLGGGIGGATGIAATLAIDYFDDLLLDSLLNNWKPNQYIEGDYKDFLNLRI